MRPRGREWSGALLGALAALALGGCGPGGGAADLPDCAGLELAVDFRWAHERLAELSGAAPMDLGGDQVWLPDRASANNRATARTWLRRQAEAMGFAVSEHAYATGVNLVADRPGARTDELVLVVAHYDTVAGAPGADDNGSGVVAALGVGRALSGCQAGPSVRLVAFDEEELGLVGSTAYVDHLAASGELAQVRAVFNLDMVGFDWEGSGIFFSVDCDKPGAADLTGALAEVVEGSDLDLTLMSSCALMVENSDHKPFWEAGAPAIYLAESQFAEDWSSVKALNSCYHQPCDTIDKLDLRYLAAISSALARTIAVGAP